MFWVFFSIEKDSIQFTNSAGTWHSKLIHRINTTMMGRCNWLDTWLGCLAGLLADLLACWLADLLADLLAACMACWLGWAGLGCRSQEGLGIHG